MLQQFIDVPKRELTVEELLNEIADEEMEEERQLIFESGDYPKPPLSRGADCYLARFDGHRADVEARAMYIAACYGSRFCERLHVIMAAKEMGIYRK